MINSKYYQDIKQFPSQFKQGIKLTQKIKVDGKFNRIVVCGVGGSALYVDMINNFLDSYKNIKIRLEVSRSYDIPKNSDSKTLFIIASYSGNTEETLEALRQVVEKEYSFIILAAGGKLLEEAKKHKVPFFQIPSGLQPRLSTGFFISGLLNILANSGLIPDLSEDLLKATEKMDDYLDEGKTQEIAEALENMVPIIYSTDENWGIARISKIKFNENSKIQSFWNFFPEMNHNEMVGFTKMVMDAFFIVFESKFTNERNKKRIDIFTQIMREKHIPVEVIDMKGDSVIEEMLNAYYFVDHITYYLAEKYGIDPEPVDMVEDFKVRLTD